MNKRKTILSSVILLIASALHAQEKLIWSDEFNSNALDTTVWNIQKGYGSNNDGWGNHEWQNYTADNISFKDGKLLITAIKIGEGQKRGDYTSARITTGHKKEFTYGRMEARIKLPKGKGVWPAFWMLGEGRWPDCGEIDILEYVGYDTSIAHSALHTRSSFGETVNVGFKKYPNLEDDFHVFGINWTKDKIEFYVDDRSKPYYTYNPTEKNEKTWPFDKPMHFILNFAVGGGFGGRKGVDDNVYPQTFMVDWVRVYQ
ncbi:family 16 glycosylhydrolase [Chitinophagaceae bacterium LWZ2-11]